MIPPIEINNKTKLDEQYRMEAKAQRRKIKEGYPRESPFQSPEESYEYLSQESIDCLLCGRRMQTLAKHLASIHHISADDYKTKYGLPYSRGLTSTLFEEKIRQSQKERAAREVRDMDAIRPLRHTGQGERPSHHRYMVNARKILTVNHPRKWIPETIEPVIRRLEAGESVHDVFVTAGNGFREAVKGYPDLLKRYKKAIETAKRARGFDLKVFEEAKRHA